MAFQFLCPQGHLLEGDESQQGQPCDCPMCGMRFLIPVLQGPPHPAPGPAPETAAFPDFTSAAPAEPAPLVEPEPETPREPRLLHIPCPNGHELETPEEMLGQDVLCPLCGEQFSLQFKDSVEYKEEKEREREREESRMAQVWFNRAIIAAVVVVLGLILMIVISSYS